jgi:hypothetical protein
VSEAGETGVSQRADHPPGLSGWPRDPYKGLNYFSAADAPLFGQREAEIDDMLALLCSFDTKVVLLHGGTGTGKSSFLRAGLCPRLQQMPVEEGRQFFFLQETRSGDSDDPLLIRATDDPVARIYEALRKAAETESSPLSEAVRQTLREQLSGDIPRDRLKAVPAILTALRAMTAPPQRAIFVLLVDQAEEVLTLPATSDAENRRSAFFALIEQTCFRLRSIDLRLVVALRTEYYGRFCSYFRIRPTINLTPATEVGAGLFDYLLRPLGAPDIAAAIRQPTSDAPRHDGLPAPRSVYGFFYQEKLPETIAADLLDQSGEASTLPAMQIVCKQLHEGVVLTDRRAEITDADYEFFGRAQGVIEAFMARAIRAASFAAGLLPLDEPDVDSWTLVLSKVVGRAEGGTVQTLIASERDLLTEATKLGIREDDARSMLNKMADPELRLLRVAGGEAGTTAYSLGHDSLGPSVLRRSAQAAARREEEKKQAETLLAERAAAEMSIRKKRNRMYLTVAAVASSISVAASFLVGYEVPSRYKASALATYAENDQSADFRLKLLLAVAALRTSNALLGHWFVGSDGPRNVLKGVLLRSPVFAGTFEAAAWSADGKRVVWLQDNTIVVRDLATEKESRSPLPDEDAGAPTSVGLTRLSDGTEAVAAFRIPKAQPIAGLEGSTLMPSPFAMPERLDTGKGIFISRADIFGTHFRVIAMNFAVSAINKIWVVPLSGTIGAPFEVNYPAGELHELDWNPISRNALRLPALADDCDAYAFLGRNERTRDQGMVDEFKLWIGQLTQDKAAFVPIKGYLNVGAVAIGRGCRAVIVRDDSSKLHMVSLDQDLKGSLNKDKRPDLVSVSLDSIPGRMAGIMVPPLGQAQPMLAAAPIRGGWRVAWPSADGLTLVDIEEKGDGLRATPVLLKEQMLTGIEANYAQGSLGLSPDGTFAFLWTQQNFSARVQLRAFDLDLDRRWKRLSALSNDKLIEEACRVARFQTGFNFLTHTELEIWLGSRGAPQPCTGKE